MAPCYRLNYFRFYSKLGEGPDTMLENFTINDGKTFFNWIKENFKDSIKANGTLSIYWWILK